jgi:hypothetical protein
MARIVLSPFLERDLQNHPTVRAATAQAAQKIVTNAKRIARVEAYQTGAYMRGHVVQPQADGSAIAAATDYKSTWLEFGTRNRDGSQRMRPRASLRRGAQQAGLTVRPR